MRQEVLSAEDFACLARLLRRRGGLVLNVDKTALLLQRLQPVMGRFGFKTVGGLLDELRLGRDALAQAVTEAMTVNESSFFRDPAVFARLSKEILPALLAARAKTRRLRIWSAATATGQEAYSLAILLDGLGLIEQGWVIDLIATDISGAAIARAQTGHYSQFEIRRGLSFEDIARHFRAQESGFTVSERLRRMVTFRRFNLMDSFGWLDDLDLVLCRNALMYFDRDTKISVLERIADTLAGDGVLLLGEAESPDTLTSAFTAFPGDGGFYAKKNAQPARFGLAV